MVDLCRAVNGGVAISQRDNVFLQNNLSSFRECQRMLSNDKFDDVADDNYNRMMNLVKKINSGKLLTPMEKHLTEIYRDEFCNAIINYDAEK